MLICGGSVRAAQPDQQASGGSIPTSPLQKSPWVTLITLREANALLVHHYLGPVRSAIICFGHEEGCTVWGVPRSRSVHDNMRAAGFSLIELVRMVGIPGHKWATSSLLSHSVWCLFSAGNFDSAITYADREAFHTGATYLAANWRQIEDAQPDGFTWWLDGGRVSRKRFYKEFGSSAIERVKAIYGDRLRLVPDVPKKRFIFLRDWGRLNNAESAMKKIKTWGVRRVKQHESTNDCTLLGEPHGLRDTR
jgi:hypothetical protein